MDLNRIKTIVAFKRLVFHHEGFGYKTNFASKQINVKHHGTSDNVFKLERDLFLLRSKINHLEAI